MNIYIASKSSNKNFALLPESIIEVCYSYCNPLEDANSYARDYTKKTEEPAWVYEVEIRAVGGFKMFKEVGFVAAK